mgnify:FL=1
MKRLFAAVILFLLLLFVAILTYFFGDQITTIFNQDPVQQQITENQINISGQRPLSKVEQKKVLDELLPQNVIDTKEEFEEQVDLLDQLQQQAPVNNDVNILNQLQGQTSTEQQLKQLEALQN